MSQFHIRPYQKNDLEEVYAAADESRQHVARWMDWMTPDYSLDHARQWIDLATSSWSKTAYEHAIVETATGTIVGSCGLNRINDPSQTSLER